jgi:hypothetical protein
MDVYEFEAELWEWEARPGTYFVTVPAGESEDLRLESGPPRGFGSVRVEATVGTTTWRTSVFPDATTGCFVLPMKHEVRRAAGLDLGDRTSVSIRLVEGG